MRDTWYVLEDDSVVSPSEVTNENGVLTHKNGKVAMRGDVPSTRGVEIDEETGLRAFDGPHDHLDKHWVADADRDKPFAGKSGSAADVDSFADLTVPQLKTLAADKNIDLGDATKRADIVAVLEKALEPDAANGGYKTREMKAS